ncbi:hypothetical protein RCL1_007038 [Eukaryota sp. TZLM3-RCL]
MLQQMLTFPAIKVVRCRLEKIVCNKEIISTIEKTVLNQTIVNIRARYLLKLYLIRKFEKEILEVTAKDSLPNLSFGNKDLYGIIRTVSKAKCAKLKFLWEEIYFNDYLPLLKTDTGIPPNVLKSNKLTQKGEQSDCQITPFFLPCGNNSTQIEKYIAKEIMTNYKVNTQENFPKILAQSFNIFVQKSQSLKKIKDGKEKRNLQERLNLIRSKLFVGQLTDMELRQEIYNQWPCISTGDFTTPHSKFLQYCTVILPKFLKKLKKDDVHSALLTNPLSFLGHSIFLTGLVQSIKQTP